MNDNPQHRKKWMPAMYVAYFGILEKILNKHGYILSIHGSVVRDFDIIAVPFDDIVSPHKEVLADIEKMVGQAAPEMNPFYSMEGMEPHGRKCYAIECGGGGYFDISFTPSLQDAMDQIRKEEKKELERDELLGKLIIK